MDSHTKPVTLAELAAGAAGELFDHKMREVALSIRDPNTKPSAKRRVTLVIEMVPTEDREMIACQVNVSATLPGLKPYQLPMFVQRIDGEYGFTMFKPQSEMDLKDPKQISITDHLPKAGAQ